MQYFGIEEAAGCREVGIVRSFCQKHPLKFVIIVKTRSKLTDSRISSVFCPFMEFFEASSLHFSSFDGVIVCLFQVIQSFFQGGGILEKVEEFRGGGGLLRTGKENRGI